MSARRKTDSPGAREGGMHHSGGLAGIPDEGAGNAPADARTPAATTQSWDPYQVWLTRVKEPRERSARTRMLERGAIESAVPADLGDTARLRTLSPAP